MNHKERDQDIHLIDSLEARILTASVTERCRDMEQRAISHAVGLLNKMEEADAKAVEKFFRQPKPEKIVIRRPALFSVGS